MTSIPVWITANLCVLLYLAGLGIPYAIDYMSHKEYRRLVRDAIARYSQQKRTADARRRQQCQERISTTKTFNSRTRAIEYTPSSSSSSSSSSESDEEDEEMNNDRKTLMQYVHGVDLFDGQSSHTSSSAATTIMLNTQKKKPHKPGAVRHV